MNATSVAPDVDLSQVAALGESLLTELDRLRESDPIHWSPATGAWLVTRHADIVRAFAGELPLSVNPSRRPTFTVIPPEEVGAIEEFDAVVLGSAVYMGQWMKPARLPGPRIGGLRLARSIATHRSSRSQTSTKDTPNNNRYNSASRRGVIV